MNFKKILPVLFGLMVAGHSTNAQIIVPAKDSETVFKQFFDRATAFANMYPREEAYLHFDNSSYYVGDTIWFKAYVTLADRQVFSPISKPLYVELLDQTGHIIQDQIVELTNGEGNGQIVLNRSTFSGYYEIRAYTKWMLAFGEPTYFSRTFPVYQQVSGDNQRNISTYNLNPSMKQRPKEISDRFRIQFFPEGGSLVEGVESKVAFKAESRDSGEVNCKGLICDRKGNTITSFETMHDGMGVFTFTPGTEQAVAQVTYGGKDYQFKLPKALEAGYVIGLESVGGGVVYHVASNSATPEDDVAVFITREGRPYTYQIIKGKKGESVNYLFKTKGLPGGIYQFSVLNRKGQTLAERFCFVQSGEKVGLTLNGTKEMYHPYEAIRCELQLKDQAHQPIAGSNISVSIRDAMNSDYAMYDNTLYTDMLLTSGLKGYIHQPGYYFANVDLQKLKELDALLMVHGWRRYNMSLLTASKPAEPSTQPETSLLLHGQIKSAVLGKELKDIMVSVTVLEDSTLLVGETEVDQNGRFDIPVANFNGSVEALFQTKKKGSKRKKYTSIRFDRNFSPSPRAYAFEEWHPAWMPIGQWRSLARKTEQNYLDSIMRTDSLFILQEVEVSAKRKNKNVTTQVFEKSIDAYYDVQRCLDELRDEGKVITTIPDMMKEMDNPSYYFDPRNLSSTYNSKTICCVMDDRILDPMAAWMFWNNIDGIDRIMICEGANSATEDLKNSLGMGNNVLMSVTNSASDIGSSSSSESGTSQERTFDGRTFDDTFYNYDENNNTTVYNINNNINLSHLENYAMFYLSTTKLGLINKNTKDARGTRRTYIQGYTQPMEFYSPAYKDINPMTMPDDKRRTLYWNPNVKTDAEGKAIIECYNADNTNPLIIQVETLKDGIPGSYTFITAPDK